MNATLNPTQNPQQPQSSNAANWVALASLRAGQKASIRDTSGLDAEDAALLRAMGLGLNALIRVFRIGHPVVVAVGGVNAHCKCGGMCRVGLARRLADVIRVEVQN